MNGVLPKSVEPVAMFPIMQKAPPSLPLTLEKVSKYKSTALFRPSNESSKKDDSMFASSLEIALVPKRLSIAI